jgi:uncharacterized oxidoreductase
MKLSGNKILITGGASGIGLGLTERFLKEGNIVIICGRRADVLKAVADKHPGLITKVSDLSRKAERVALYNWIAAEHADLNVLVNNAGMQNWMNLSDDDFFERAQVEISTNIEAPVHLTQLFARLPSLTAIMNVTSGLAFVAFSKVPVYSATKAFFRSFTLSVRHLLKGRGIEVIEIIPPALDTDLGGKGIHDGNPPVSEFVEAIFAQLAEGKTELAYGFAQVMLNAGPTDVQAAFNRLNP